MKIQFLKLIFLYIVCSHAALAIDPVYEGDNGIRATVFATNCLSCHSSELTGSQRNGAPTNINWDTYSETIDNADRAVVRAVDQMTMPPSFSGLPTLDQDQKNAMLAWQQAGFPENQSDNNQTNATFDFENLILTLPVVHVGELTYLATLKLIDIADSVLGFGFILETAELTQNNSTTAATFNLETNIVEIPEIDLINNNDSSNKVSAQMLFIPGSESLQFEVLSVTSLN